MMRFQDAAATTGGDAIGGSNEDEFAATDGHGDSHTGTEMSNIDLLSYVGDMIYELQLMTERTGCATLLGLLALARSEAMVRQQALALRQALR
jgi:hypothetical protein